VFGQSFGDDQWSITTVTSNDVFAVSCVTNSSGWVAGAHGFVAHTIDGGKSFVTQTTPFSSALRALSFADESLGVVAGDGGALGVTHDGGAHWVARTSGTPATLRGAATARMAGLLLVVGDDATLVVSHDGGSTWKARSIPGAANLHGVAVDPSAAAILAVDDGGTIWSSGDGARSFMRVFTSPAPLDGVQMLPTGEAIAVGAKGTVAVRLGGAAWSILSTGVTADLHAGVIAPEDGSLYVAGEGGTFLESDDRGAHFSPVELMMTAPIYAVDAL
jgi:photosystem II stability/assembly factor-like uncharacterized protein